MKYFIFNEETNGLVECLVIDAPGAKLKEYEITRCEYDIGADAMGNEFNFANVFVKLKKNK